MTREHAIGFIQGKINCMEKCNVFDREENINNSECENCEYCYSQGNLGEQIRAFKYALKWLKEKKNDK